MTEGRGAREALLRLILVFGFACREPPSDPVILALEGQTVRRSDFERHIKTLEAGGPVVEPAVREALLAPFLEERVLVIEARRRGLVGRGVSPADEQNGVQKLLGEVVLSHVSVKAEEIAAYYREHAGEFRMPETVTLRQVLLSTEEKARRALERLQKDPGAFEGVARAESKAPEAGAGGLMGVFAPGELPPELDLAAFKLPVGGTSNIIRTSLGYHILRVDSRRPSHERNLEESKDAIRTRLAHEKADRDIQEFVRGLMARAKVNHEAAKASSRDS